MAKALIRGIRAFMKYEDWDLNPENASKVMTLNEFHVLWRELRIA